MVNDSKIALDLNLYLEGKQVILLPGLLHYRLEWFTQKVDF